MKLKHLGALVLGLMAANAMACYTVYDRNNRVAYQGEEPPVDMSLPLHRALQARFPGGHMVFEQTADCRPIGLAELARPLGPAVAPNTVVMGSGPGQRVASLTPSPATAVARANIPSFPGGVPSTAVMGAAPARFADPGLSTMAPRNLANGSSPLLTDKRTAVSMGLPHTTLSGNIVMVPARAAANANPNAVSAPLPITDLRTSAARTRNDVVITELHNPPLTVVQSGGDVVVTKR